MSLTAVMFEVMDKEWPLWFVLLGFAGVGVAGFFCMQEVAARGNFDMDMDGAQRLAIAVGVERPVCGGHQFEAKLDILYAFLSYASVSVAALFPTIGLWQNRVERKNGTPLPRRIGKREAMGQRRPRAIR